MLNFLNKLQVIIFYLFFFLYPVIFANITFEPTEHAKLLFLIVTTIILVTLNSFKLIIAKKIEFGSTRFLIPLFIIALIYILTSIFVSPNQVLPWVTTLSTSTWVFILMFYILLSSQKNAVNSGLLDLTVFGSAFSALYVILMYAGIIPQGVTTPIGNVLATSIFFLILIIYLALSFSIAFADKKYSLRNALKKNILRILSFALIVFAQTFLIFHIVTDQKPILLPNNIGFSIFQEVADDPKNIFLGVGPTNFITAFTLGKPASINQTALWNITFTSSSSLFTNLLTETGIISGLAYFSLILISLYQFIINIAKSNWLQSVPLVCLIFLGTLLLFFPGSMSLMILFSCLMGITDIRTNFHEIKLHKLKYILFLLSAAAISFACIVLYLGLKSYLAEYHYFAAFEALQQKNLSLAYNLQKEAINNNPLIDKYHLGISQTSLFIADEFLKKEEKTEAETRQIPSLISQSIEEGRRAVNLNKTNIINWANLTKIYSSLITYAPGAEKWAVEIGLQTIALDPNNPKPYVSLSNIYRTLGQNAKSDELLDKARNLKPDLPYEGRVLEKSIIE